MFIAALFTRARTWKQPKCPSTDEWIRKMWYIYTMEYYSAIKKNDIMPFSATWIELETLILSEVSQKDINDITYMWSLKYGTNYLQNRNRLTDIESRPMVAKGWGKWDGLGV